MKGILGGNFAGVSKKCCFIRIMGLGEFLEVKGQQFVLYYNRTIAVCDDCACAVNTLPVRLGRVGGDGFGTAD